MKKQMKKQWYISTEYTVDRIPLVLEKLTKKGVQSEDIKLINSSVLIGTCYCKVIYLSEKEIL